VGSEELEIVSVAGGGPATLPEPEPPHALRRAVVLTKIMTRKGFRIEGTGRDRRVIGFMGLEIPILAQGISRGIFLYQFTVSSPTPDG
jgi:hypothetical protein